MRILIITQYIYPETFKSTDIAFELAKRGHKVEVLTGIPNYPEGKYYSGYGLFSKRVETINNVKFFRCLQTPRKLLPGYAGLFLNYLTFAVNSIAWIIFRFIWAKRYDAIITHEPSPITQIIPAIILGKIKNIPVYSWIMDIWPDSMTCHLRGIYRKITYPPLNSLTNWIYRNSHKILITSKDFSAFINRDSDYSDKIIYFPNWSEDILKQPIKPTKELPQGFNIMMVGNIGSGIGITSLINLFDECRDIKELNFVFIGDGSSLKEMKDMVKKRELSNVFFMGRHPQDMMHSFISKADCMLLTLAAIDLPFLNATVPARLQTYMSAGKPILGMIDGGASKIIIDNDLGFCVPAGDYKALAKFIKDDLLRHRDRFKLKGANARKLYEDEYNKKKCIDNLERIIIH